MAHDNNAYMLMFSGYNVYHVHPLIVHVRVMLTFSN